jgi:hypothetical protein
MADQNFWQYEEDFFGSRVFSVTQADDPNWRIDILGSAVVPALVTPSSSGEAILLLESTTEAQSVNIYQSDILQYDIDKIRTVKFRVKMGQATLDATSHVAFGVASGRADDVSAITQHALFHVNGSTSTTVVYCETDDGTNDESASSAATLVAAYKDFEISFALGTSDVRFFIDGQPVATATTFDMSNYTGSLQLYVQIGKTSDNNINSCTVDRISIEGIR